MNAFSPLSVVYMRIYKTSCTEVQLKAYKAARLHKFSQADKTCVHNGARYYAKNELCVISSRVQLAYVA